MKKAELIPIIQASIEAGKAILEVYHTDFSVDHKADDSPLTLADRRSHQTIAPVLKRTNIPVMSEEGRNIPYEERKHWERLWIVDPLDGTKEFIKRNDEFTVNIALVEAGKPQIGIIYVPVGGVLYLAHPEAGAVKVADGTILDDVLAASPDKHGKMLDELLLKSEKLTCSPAGNREYTIVGSRSHATPELQAFVEEQESKRGRVTFISAGSSLKFCQVAEGNADIYPRLGPTMEWDTAAGQAIVQHAGGEVLLWNSDQPLRYNKPDLLNPNFVVQRRV